MINAETAYRICQDANRTNWLNLLKSRISSVIEDAARCGKSEVELVLSDYIIGAETLNEYCEMIDLLKRTIRDNAYLHKILPNGNLLIQWK